jgi:hypothetical protein
MHIDPDSLVIHHLLRGFQFGPRQRQPGARLLHLRLGDVQVLAGQEIRVLIVYALQAPVGCLLQFKRGLSTSRLASAAW